ncbi:midcut-by-XrtH protein [Candidatus Thiodictyon syntrophicum]|jgi:hypothetical protein|uniref:Midcut-by-XrtH protein n=1 Tax=Candidatus Thiodictyon syntrophicum TaxID=1166950 RepID=A0A2K8U5I2_9GAMM|nr:midcut-by-XrtH protein [Candidatus Thiodictyon syntrophicum]AUB80846.1 hypothetical protein THSYN_07700 [Candidatus Thiodictyon syntrophicum]
MSKSSRILKFGAFMGLGSLVLIPGLALAQAANGSITFGRLGATSALPIPTLGGTMLILLALSLGFLAYRSVRKGQGYIASLLAGALAVGSLVSVTGGFNLLRDAYAAAVTNIISDPAGGTFPIVPHTTNIYDNQSGVPMSVIAISLPPACESSRSVGAVAVVPTTQCMVGVQVGNSMQCNFACGDI